MTQSRGNSSPDSRAKAGVLIGRMLSTLILLAWGALAATQALAGWNNLVSTMTGSYVLLIAGLFLYGSKAKRENTVSDGPVSVAVSIACVLLPLLMTGLLRGWPASILAATWAVVMALVFAILLFNVRWLSRVMALIWAGAGLPWRSSRWSPSYGSPSRDMAIPFRECGCCQR